ncbi:signal peptidase I [Lachnospiraceae bacterium]|nr:signal peptidase I [Lachnospiraceae bacterium]
MKKKTTDKILSASITILMALVLTFLFITFVGQRNQIDGNSMEMTLSNGESVLLDKFTYRFSSPRRFDIVDFPCPTDAGSVYIKRIIGLPGETVEIKDGVVYINGDKLKGDHYGNSLINDAGLASSAVSLGADEYFVLGDNRNDSVDSRSPEVGNIRKSDIMGKVWLRLSPINKFGMIK